MSGTEIPYATRCSLRAEKVPDCPIALLYGVRYCDSVCYARCAVLRWCMLAAVCGTETACRATRHQED
eukprot:5457-Rhodomonas_salina.3